MVNRDIAAALIIVQKLTYAHMMPSLASMHSSGGHALMIVVYVVMIYYT